MNVSAADRIALLATTSSKVGPGTPRSDIELLSAKPGTYIVPPPPPNVTRKLENILAFDLRHAIRLRETAPSVCLSFSERVGAAAAMINPTVRHLCVTHNFNAKRRAFERLTRWMRRVESVVVVSTRQRELLLEAGLAETQVRFVRDYIDSTFFDPNLASNDVAIAPQSESYVLAVGQEQRDYALLIAALAQVDIPAVVVPSSTWVTSGGISADLPKNVSVRTKVPYEELRALYQDASAVVVPVVKGTEYAAGVNGLLEGLSMARPVIVSDTPGLKDYLDSRRMTIVPAGDRDAMIEALSHVGSSAFADQARLGRQSVLDSYTVEAYVASLSDLIWQ